MGWPKFDDEQSLNADAWGRYFESVYGGVPSFGYPICIFDFWYLYTDKLNDASIAIDGSDCPSNEGDYFGNGKKPPIGYQIKEASWIWHPGPWSGLESTTWVEVTHSAAPAKAESNGAWFFRAPGSGLWVNLGNTKSYTAHHDIFSEFTDCSHGNYYTNDLCPCGQKHGADSLQFLSHTDNEWKCFGTSTALDIEIVMCDLDGSKACGGKSGAFRAGWMASQSCDCVEGGGPANCQSPNIAPR